MYPKCADGATCFNVVLFMKKIGCFSNEIAENGHCMIRRVLIQLYKSLVNR
jgi:hypothetical protein